MAIFVQELVEREVRTTLAAFLKEEMDDVDGGRRGWKSLKQRLGLKGVVGCCGGGPMWSIRASNMSVRDDDIDDHDNSNNVEVPQNQQFVTIDHVGQSPTPENSQTTSNQACVGQISAVSGMNLAAALAAERQYRSTQESSGGDLGGPTSNRSSTAGTAPGTPLRVSLMRLLEETDGGDGEKGRGVGSVGGVGSDSVCCVCMGRKKGAAFIPCGHTFCRVCSRELWLNRGSCPLCNRSILEILDIF